MPAVMVADHFESSSRRTRPPKLMEIGFDKEIDALLRKARGGGAVAARDEHLDADTIAAFAENALPAAARLVHMKHLADCDRCRRILADVAAVESASAAEPARIVTTAAVPAAAPWYSKIFGLYGLSAGLATLVIFFVGAYVVIVNQRGGDAATANVARLDDDRLSSVPAASAPNTALQAPAGAANANAAANVVGPEGSTLASNSTSVANTMAAAKPAATPGSRVDSAASGTLPVDEKAADKDRLAAAEPKAEITAQAPAPPPPALGTTGGAASTARKADEAERSENTTADDMRMSKRSGTDVTRDLPAPAAKSGPARSGPLQNQNVQSNKLGEMSVTRTVRGRSFNYRDGVWYDTAYRSQGTVNFRRGTEEYSKLDGGLRTIADSIGGPVVVVWKGKAYRIQ